jgi:hypothetical protein
MSTAANSSGSRGQLLKVKAVGGEQEADELC